MIVFFFKKLSIITIKTFICFIFTFIFIIFSINLIFLDFFWFEFLEPRQWSILFYFLFFFYKCFKENKKKKNYTFFVSSLTFTPSFSSWNLIVTFICPWSFETPLLDEPATIICVWWVAVWKFLFFIYFIFF